MRRIALQAGHENIGQNIDPALRGGTGAPGEMEFTVRIRNRLSEVLINKGFQVFLTDANANGDTNYTTQDFDLFLAIHYDANVYGTGGGGIFAPDASVDASTVESTRIRDVMRGIYFSNSGIEEHEERANGNTQFYYMWNVLTAKTPCILIECGVGQDAHDSVILADTERVTAAIARGICAAFNVVYDPPAPTPAPEPAPAPEPPQPPTPSVPTPPAYPDLSRDLAACQIDVKTLSDKLAKQQAVLQRIKQLSYGSTWISWAFGVQQQIKALLTQSGN
jgi:hypothetical protein